MKAIIASGGNQIDLDENHAEPTLKSGEVLVKIAATPIQPSDALNVAGNFPQTKFPTVPGRDYSGTVVAPESSSWHGKRVYGTSGSELSISRNGAEAEFVAVPESALAEIPSNLDFLQASLVGTPWTTAYLTLLRTHAKKGDTVVVIGAGGNVGSAIVELAKSSLFECNVLKAGRGDKYDVNTSSSSALGAVSDKTDKRGADIVIDATGSLDLAKAGLTALAKGGRLAIISTGASHGSTETGIDFKALYRAEHSIIGCNSLAHSMHEAAVWMKELTKAFESGELSPPKADGPRITKIGLDGVVDAYKQLADGSHNVFLVQPNGDGA